MTTASSSPRATRGNQVAWWWWMLAGAALVPTALPLLTILWEVATGPTRTGITQRRLIELGFNTLVLAATVTLMAVLMGAISAWLVTRTSVPVPRLWSSLIVLPLVIPSYVMALAIIGLAGPGGLLTMVVPGLPRPEGFVGAAIALTAYSIPYVHLAMVPAFRGLDPAIEEAATGLGSSRASILRKVTIPTVRPALTASALLVSLYTISDFGVVSLLRYDTFTRAVYTQFNGRLDRRPALFLAMILMLIAGAIVVAEARARGRSVRMRSRVVRPATVIRLSRAQKAIGVGFLGGGVMAALVLPVTVLGYWLARGLLAGQALDPLWAEAWRSLSVSLLAAAVTVVFSLPLAVVAARAPGRWSKGAEGFAWLGYALPHITIGLAILTLTLRWARPLYQTVTVLVLAYVVMFLPQALAATREALSRVSPSLEEASRSLGKSPWETSVRVVLPLISRGVAAGAALVFLTTIKELPATLLLRPNGFDTLSIRIWASTSEAFYTRAAAASLLLLAVSAIPLAMVTLREIHR